MKYPIKHISAKAAEASCRQIMADLSEYQEHHALGVRSCNNFAFVIRNVTVGLLSLDFPYPTNGHIYWMGVRHCFQRQGIGRSLVHAAIQYARQQGALTMTVETRMPSEMDDFGLKTYQFYEKLGFSPLLNHKSADDAGNRVCMVGNLDGLLKSHSNECCFPAGQLIDLTHTLDASIPSWDAVCGFENTLQLDYSDCVDAVKFRVQRITMDAGIGTHLDAPAHCVPGGLTIDQLSSGDLQANCVVVDVSNKAHERYSLSVSDIENFEREHGKIPPSSFVLIRTGWDKFWAQPEKYRNHHVFPSVSLAAAQWLLERKIVGLGIDTLSPDRPEDAYPVHAALLGAGKYIIENVANAALLPPCGSRIFAFPIKIRGGTEAPLRLLAFVPG